MSKQPSNDSENRAGRAAIGDDFGRQYDILWSLP
jgi:hypothetical protein